MSGTRRYANQQKYFTVNEIRLYFRDEGGRLTLLNRHCNWISRRLPTRNIFKSQSFGVVVRISLKKCSFCFDRFLFNPPYSLQLRIFMFFTNDTESGKRNCAIRNYWILVFETIEINKKVFVFRNWFRYNFYVQLLFRYFDLEMLFKFFDFKNAIVRNGSFGFRCLALLAVITCNSSATKRLKSKKMHTIIRNLWCDSFSMAFRLLFYRLMTIGLVIVFSKRIYKEFFRWFVYLV